MESIVFSEQIRAMSSRLESLYQGISTSSLADSAHLPAALKELGIASERLQLAAELLHQQRQELIGAKHKVEIEQQRHQGLLEFIPDACFVTDLAGVIQEANRATAELLHLKQSLLIGRSLTAFVAPETQHQLQAQLKQLYQRPWRQELPLRLQPPQGTAVDVVAIVGTSQPQPDQPLTVRWLLRDRSERKRVEAALEQSDNNPYRNRPVQFYHKGEIIPLDPKDLWQVRQGLVKLTTFCNSGEELLVGLAGASAPFGPSLVAAPLYQAIALVDTQLWCIPIAEIEASPYLAQSLLHQLSQRLKQSEALLAVYGQQRVEDRLNSLLSLLKQEIGEPVPEGIRLGVRLTHDELASACRTTRVTVTRSLSKLAQQQKISIDAKHHLILKDWED